MGIAEIVSVSLSSLRANKLRALLTVLGIVVGIFSIIVIMTVITALQSSIESGVSMLSKNTFQIQKFPAIQMGGPGSRAKYRNRKDITVDEFYRLKETLTLASYVGAEQWMWGRLLRFDGRETNPNVSVAGITPEAIYTNNWIVASGRAIMQSDVDFSASIILLGKDVADKLFPNGDPVGQYIRLEGRPLLVVGVLESQGQLFGQGRDNLALLPLTTYQSFYGKRNRSINITVMAPSQESYDAVIESAIGHMRTIRKVPPGQENDFEIFSNESLIAQINETTQYVELGAIAISLISLLAAGIGIMNIMLVSVTERTKEIGIRKAVGARKINILTQFLVEAITLCIFGGIIGIILGVALGNLAGSFLNAQFVVPLDWVVVGVFLCIIVGLVFGTYPAYKAANLDPIEALRYE